MKSRKVLFFLMMLFVGIANSVFAQEQSKPALWKWTSTTTGEKKSNLFNGPQLNWPKLPSFQGVRRTTGQALSNVKKTTGKWWNSTVDLMNPWKEERAKSRETSGGWFFQKKEEQPSYSTVNDFLKQERPRL